MNKFERTTCSLPWMLLCFLLLALPQPGLGAKEDTVRLFFDQTAHATAKTTKHIVAKGDSLSRIVCTRMGNFPEAERARILQEIMALNPEIENADRIFAGQVLILPARGNAVADVAQKESYKARRGDSLTRIVAARLNAGPKDVPRAIRMVRELNPEITNPDLIFPGQSLKLPGGFAATVTQRGPSEEPVSQDEAKPQIKAPLPLAKISAIRVVLERMNGILCTTGNYHIPLPETGQVTIDCAVIPVVELNDGSIIALDFGNRLPDDLNRVVRSNRQNYHFLKVSEADSAGGVLQKIFKQSKSYTMSRSSRAFVVGEVPQIRLTTDWTISRRNREGGTTLVQTLSFPSDEARTLPDAITAYAARNGTVVTEIFSDTGAARAASPAGVCTTATLVGEGGCDLAFTLLRSLGFEPARNTDVKVFDRAREGFNLSIVADILVKDGERKVLILSKKIPAQFIDILSAHGADIAFLPGGEGRKATIEKTLTACRIPSASRIVSFVFAGGRGIIDFPAIEVRAKGSPVYLVDFDMDQDICGLLSGQASARILRY